jgi:hypothetical protein
MANCVLTSTPEFRKLYDSVFPGKEFTQPQIAMLASAVAVWQEENGLDKYPTRRNLGVVDPIGEWEALDGRQSGATKLVTAYSKDELEALETKFPGTVITESKDVKNRKYYKAVVPRPGVEVTPKLSESQIKPEVEELFDSNPELAKIGTVQEYSQYLDTIFPDSKVKDIVYRGDGAEMLTKAVNSIFGTGYYFTPKKEFAESFAEIAASRDKGYGLYTALLNIITPLNYNETVKNYKTEKTKLGKTKEIYKQYALNKLENKEDIPFLIDLANGEITSFLYTYSNGKYFSIRGKEVSIDEIKFNIDAQILKSPEDYMSTTTEKSDLENINKELTSNNDGIVININEKYTDINKEYVVFNPEQIHILGSKQDIEGFREFVNKSTAKTSNTSRAQIEELTAQRNQLKEQYKPNIRLSFVTNKQLVESTDPEAAKAEQDAIKDEYKELLNLLKCLGI